ncbi:MAG: hotdog fold thioesterase [Enterobacteriaceae bacterium]
MIWKRQTTLEQLNRMGEGNMVGLLDIHFDSFTDDTIEATMPVDSRTHQPFGLLHVGVGGISGNFRLGGRLSVQLKASRRWWGWRSMLTISVRFAAEGFAACAALHVGSRHQVWQIDISDEQGRLCCSSRLTTAVI